MATLNGIDLGTVKRESSTKASTLISEPMPYSDSDETLLMDLMGVTRTITVEGVKTGTLSELRTFINNIENLQNGSQSGMTFVSSWTGSSKTVLIQEFSHTKMEADENKIEYTLVLMEGTAI